MIDRETVIQSFLERHPHLVRKIFVHIPKCAGTDLVHHKRLYLSVPTNLREPEWYTDEALAEAMASLDRQAVDRGFIFVHGHIELRPFMRHLTRRPGDEIFAVLRNPVEIMVSQVNYKFGRMRADPEGTAPDTREMFAALGVDRVPDDAWEARHLALEALTMPEFAMPGLICRGLCGAQATAEEALECVRQYNVELTDTLRYGAWIRERWGIDESQRLNRSVPVITTAEAAIAKGPYLREATREDRLLYGRVLSALERLGRSSVKGSEL